MQIRIASTNPKKIEAVAEAVQEFGWKNASFESVAVSSDVSSQPRGLEEILRGAKNRAQNAFEKNSVGVGIEGGVIKLEKPAITLSLTACCVFDGQDYCFGLSSAYELPRKVAELMENQQKELQDAVFQAGLTRKQKIGREEGFVSLVTNQRVTRKDLTKQALLMAFSKLEQKARFF